MKLTWVYFCPRPLHNLTSTQPLLVEDLSNFLNALKTEPNKDEKKKKKDHSKKDAITPSKKPENSTKKRAEDPKPLKSKGERKKPIKKVEDAKDVPKEEESILKSKTPLQQPTKAKLVVAPTPHWYTAVPSLPANEGAAATPTASQLSSLMDKASSLHASDVSNYTSASASTSSTSDAKFLFKVLQSGTLSDRLSAMTLMVQGSPVHNIKALENLKNMAERGKGQGGREESLKALRCIVDWWVGGGAPDRKLRYASACLSLRSWLDAWKGTSVINRCCILQRQINICSPGSLRTG